MMINCLAIDDEPVSLNVLGSYIEQTPYLNLLAKFNNAIDARKYIHESHEVQLLFLDIRMADLNGMELARIIGQSSRSNQVRIIFTTAYDQYAIEGYRVNALDYLLKPFNMTDFSRAANKALEYFSLFEGRSNAKTMNGAINVKHYLYLKVDHQLMRLDTQDILYFEALKDYIKVYIKDGEKVLLTLTTLKRLEDKLPAGQFLRVHRSFIVSTTAIRSVTKTSVQIGQTTIYISEQYKQVFNHFLKDWTI